MYAVIAIILQLRLLLTAISQDIAVTKDFCILPMYVEIANLGNDL